MGRAIDDRNEWRDMAADGIVSDEMRFAVELYRSRRDDPCWRASCHYEILAECASAWLAAVDAGMIDAAQCRTPPT
jgi:hypothetical protein